MSARILITDDDLACLIATAMATVRPLLGESPMVVMDLMTPLFIKKLTSSRVGQRKTAGSVACTRLSGKHNGFLERLFPVGFGALVRDIRR